jgi:hypothetical protein
LLARKAVTSNPRALSFQGVIFFLQSSTIHWSLRKCTEETYWSLCS